MTNKEKLAYFDGIMDATTVEMRGFFEDSELNFLRDLIVNISLDVSTIRLWSYILAAVIEDAVTLKRMDASYGIEAKTLLKKVKSMTIPQSIWLVNEIKNQAKVA